MVRTLKNKFAGVGWGGRGIMSKEPMWTFDVNYVTQNNSYVQLLARLCMFQPLLHDLLAVVYDFCGGKMSLALHYKNLTGLCKLLPFLACNTG